LTRRFRKGSFTEVNDTPDDALLRARTAAAAECSSAAISATANRSARVPCPASQGLALSSATIRNIVADLEQLGFVSSPHTSRDAFRPTRAIRFFVDSLLKARAPIEDDPAFTELRASSTASRDDSKALVAAGIAAAFQCDAASLAW
jgi:hypothetical protein